MAREKAKTRFWWGRNYLEDAGVEESIILKWIFEKWNGGMEWIDLAQGRDRWRVLLNAVMDIRVQ
jgi:hypothetical protein